MHRWQVTDPVALALVGYPGTIGAAGKRPRFRFSTRQQRLTSYLAEIDAMLEDLGKNQTWLHRSTAAAPFTGHSPIDHIVQRGTAGAADVLRALHRTALRTALATSPTQRRRAD